MQKHKNCIFNSNAVLLHCQASSNRWLNLFNLALLWGQEVESFTL